MATAKCSSAPKPPPDGPLDWTSAVHGNCFANIDRLERWVGGTKVLKPGTDPSPFFKTIKPGSLGFGDPPSPPIYVLIHGWAPGYRDVVKANGGDILWWGPKAFVIDNGVRTWTSNWAWSAVSAPLTPAFPINSNGFLQSIQTANPSAVVLAWSWIDESATGGSIVDLVDVYQSEAYTHLNGIRLANALEVAIGPSFQNRGEVRLIGHSHGSKVATVAALTLQRKGHHVSHLTILDSPESDFVLHHNGGNLLGFYLEQMQIAQPSSRGGGECFVDNYASYFGVGYTGSANLKKVVEVALAPSELYGFDPTNEHIYAAAWYGGAAAGANSQHLPPLGFAWPPPPTKYQPTLNQTWPNGTSQLSQWQLAAGQSIIGNASYSTVSLAVQNVFRRGNVRGDPSNRLTFGPNSEDYSIFEGSYFNPSCGSGFGIAVDVLWTLPQRGDYFVITMESTDTRLQEVLLVLDGQSYTGGQTSVAINSAVTNFPCVPVDIYIFFYSTARNRMSQVTLSNFRLIEVGLPGSLSDSRPAANRLIEATLPTESSLSGDTRE